MSRHLTLIGLLQVGFIVAGWCGLAAVLKFEGYPDQNPVVRWNPIAAWLRENGIWLLLVPLLWTPAAVVLEQSDDRPVVQAVVVIAGVVFAFGMLGVFLYAAAAPFTRPLFL